MDAVVNELEQVDRAIIEALTHYYDRLGNVGYVKNSDVERLLVLSFIDDIIHDFPPLDERDYNNLYKVWDCLAASSCLIPWAEYRRYSGKKITGNTSLRVRVANNNIRVANNQVRVIQL